MLDGPLKSFNAQAAHFSTSPLGSYGVFSKASGRIPAANSGVSLVFKSRYWHWGDDVFFFLGGGFGEGPQVQNLAKSFGARDRVLASGVLDRQGFPVGIRCGGWASGFRDKCPRFELGILCPPNVVLPLPRCFLSVQQSLLCSSGNPHLCPHTPLLAWSSRACEPAGTVEVSCSNPGLALFFLCQCGIP